MHSMEMLFRYFVYCMHFSVVTPSLGSRDEYRNGANGRRPMDQANRLQPQARLYRQPVNRIRHRHLLSLLVFTRKGLCQGSNTVTRFWCTIGLLKIGRIFNFVRNFYMCIW